MKRRNTGTRLTMYSTADRVIFLLTVLAILSGTVTTLHAQIPADAADRYHDVLRRVNRGDAREAIRLGTLLIRERPGLLRTYRLVATAFIKDGAASEGVRFFDSLLAHEANRAGAHYGNASFQAMLGNREAAERELKLSIELRPDFHDAYSRLVDISRARNHYENLMNWLHARLISDSLSGALHFGIGLVHSRLGNREQAVSFMSRALALDPDAPIVNYLLGTRYAVEKQYDKAINVFKSGKEAAERLKDVQYEGYCTGNLGNVYRELHRYTKAIELYGIALEKARGLSDRNQEQVHLGNLGVSYKESGNPEEAVRLYDQALEIATELGDEYYKERTLGNMAAVLADLGRLSESISCGREAMELASMRKDSSAIAGYALNIGVAYSNTASFDSAMHYYDLSLRISESAGNTGRILFLLGNIAAVYNNQGRYLKTIETLQRALSLPEKQISVEAKALLLSNLGVAYRRVGRYEESEACTRRSLAIVDSLNDAVMKGTLLGNLGVLFTEWGVLDSAVVYIEKALINDSVSNVGRGMVQHMINLGRIADIKGDYSSSLLIQERALHKAESIASFDYVVTILRNIGSSHNHIGDFQTAMHYFSKAHSLALRLKMQASIVSIQRIIAAMQQRMGDDSLALEGFEEALCYSREEGYRGDEASVLMSMGDARLNSGHPVDAMRYYAEAFQISLESQGIQDHGGLLLHMSDAFHSAGDDMSAMEYLLEAEKIAKKLGDPIMAHDAYVGIGDIARRLKRYDQAVEWYEKSTRELESVRNALRMETDRTSFLDKHTDAYELLVIAALDAGRTADAYEYLQRFRAASAREAAQAIRQSVRADIPPDELRELHTLEFRIRELYAQLGNREVLSNPAMRIEAEHELQVSLERHSNMLASIQRRHPRWSNATGIAARLDIEAVRRMLPRGAALVEYFTSDERSAAWIIRGDTVFFADLAFTSDELAERITRLRRPFAEARDGKNLAELTFDIPLANELYKDIFLPIEKHLIPGAPLLIVPDGPLHFLPFELLVTDAAGKSAEPGVLFSEYEAPRYLIENYPISYLPGSGMLAATKYGAAGARPAKGKLLGFGAPFTGIIREPGVARAVKAVPMLSLRAGAQYRFRDLESKDVREVAAIITPSDVHLGKDATEARFKEQAGYYPNLYISSHAVADERRPLYSFIVLAQDSAGHEDGFLNAHEVFNLDLDADLVTLSACETGLGKLSRGEGIVGLTRAFLCAGASSLLMSLWSVDERSTKIMPMFYRNRAAGQSKGEALRMAKLELLRTRIDGISYAHPFLWAAFVLSGNTGLERTRPNEEGMPR